MNNMKKKLLSVLCGAALTCGIGALTSCAFDVAFTEPEPATTYTVDLAAAYDFAVELGYGGTYQDFITEIKGETGNGITSIDKTDSDGLVDTYTITFTDGTHSTFTVTNGEKGEKGEDGKTPTISIVNGYWVINGETTEIKAEAKDGDTPTIDIVNGYWTVDNVSTGVKAEGTDGHTPTITIVDGYWTVDGVSLGVRAEAKDGETPTIAIVDGYWVINNKETGIKAEAKDGETPTITIENGYWTVNGESTGVKAEAVDGKTPTIAIVEGYWVINGESTGVKAEAVDGKTPDFNVTINDDGYWTINGQATEVKAKGDKGDQGVGIDCVTIDENGNLIIKLTNQIEYSAGNILDLIQSTKAEHTVTYAFQAKDGTLTTLSSVKVKDGSTLVDPLTVYDEDFEDALLDVDQAYGSVEGWYYTYKGKEMAWFGNVVTDDVTLYCKIIDFTISYDLDDSVTYYADGNAYTAKELEATLPTMYNMGDKDVLPTTLAYYTTGEKTDDSDTRKISVMEGWQTTTGKTADFTNLCENVTVTPKWKTVDYGFSGAADETTAIISGDATSVSAYSGSKEVRYFYVITPSATSVSSNPFTGLTDLQAALVKTSMTTNTKLVFTDLGNLETAVFEDDNMTTLASSTFSGCSELKSVILPSTVTTIGSYAFQNATKFNYETNFGWKTLNSWTSVGDQAFAGLDSVTEVLIDDEHFSGLTSINQMYGSNKNLKTVEIHTNATSYSTSFASFASLESLKVYAPSATSFTATFTTNDKLNSVYIYAPNMKGTFGSMFTDTSIETLMLTDNAEYAGTEDAIIVVGSFFNDTGTLAQSMKKLTSATIDVESLTTLSATFKQDTSLTTVTVTKGNIQFFNEVFYHCKALETVTLPEWDGSAYYAKSCSNGVYNYEGLHLVFDDCDNLTNLSNPDAFEKMFDSLDANTQQEGHKFPMSAPAFKSDTGLSICGTVLFNGASPAGKVVIPAKVTTISNNAFKGGNLTSLSVAEGSQLKTIKDDAFKDCVSLASVDLSNATLLETVGKNLFDGNTSLTSVTLSESEKFTTLPYRMFAGSTTNGRVPLTSITIPKNITTIGDSVFSYTDITSVTFADGIELTSIGTNLFAETLMTSDQANKVLKGLAKAIKADANGDVKLPSYLFYVSNSSAGKNITSIVIPDEFTVIGARAFDGLSNLTSVTFEGYDATTNESTSKLKTIENNAFDGTAITSFVYQPNMTATYAFGSSSKDRPLTTVKFANGCKIKEIVNNSFYNTQITKIELPSTVETIGQHAFDNTQITEIKLPSTVTTIGNYAFTGTKITKIALPTGLTSLGTYVFQNCTELASVTVGEGTVNTLPEAITSIPQYTFKGCTKLTSFDVQDGVKTIGNYVFSGSGLETIVLSETVEKTLGTQAFYSTPLSSITVRKADGTNDGINTVPKLVTGLSTAFQNCSKLTSFVIPSNVTTSLPGNAFANCTSLATLTVPSCLGYAAATCFNGCTALKTVYITKGSYTAISCGTATSNGITTPTAYTTNKAATKYTNTPWYQMNVNGGGNVVIGTGITEVVDYAFYPETNLSIFVEDASGSLKIGNSNGYLASGKNVYYGLNTTWEYDENGVPKVK